jgi:hypothetical protein
MWTSVSLQTSTLYTRIYRALYVREAVNCCRSSVLETRRRSFRLHKGHQRPLSARDEPGDLDLRGGCPRASALLGITRSAMKQRKSITGINILVADNVVLAEVSARLHLNQYHTQFARVLQPVLFAERNVD